MRLEVGDFAFHTFAAVVAIGREFAHEGCVLLAEVIEALRPEDVGGEESVYDVEQRVLSDVLPLAVPERFGSLVAIGDR